QPPPPTRSSLSLHDALPIFFETLEGLEAGGVDELGAHEHVFVGERQQRPPVLVGHELLEHGVTLGAPLHGGQAHEQARRATDARSEEHTSELQSLAYLVCRL